MKSSYPEHQFHGAFAEEYSFLKIICPGIVDCAQQSAHRLSELPAREDGHALKVLEIGCGTGLSTRAFLDARADMTIEAMDNAPTMLDQAKVNLSEEIGSGRFTLHLNDALAHLDALPSESFDVVISNYVIHNFLHDYRGHVLPEIFRVLKVGGTFINGDRYGLDDPVAHLKVLQDEVSGYFRVFKEVNRWDLIESWVLHVLSDESLDHVMRLTPSLQRMEAIGFDDIEIVYREGIDTVLSAKKGGRIR
jgi:tRNA (cmo5U34)-methyltransferase